MSADAEPTGFTIPPSEPPVFIIQCEVSTLNLAAKPSFKFDIKSLQLLLFFSLSSKVSEALKVLGRKLIQHPGFLRRSFSGQSNQTRSHSSQPLTRPICVSHKTIKGSDHIPELSVSCPEDCGGGAALVQVTFTWTLEPPVPRS